jgi:hypothetical protein
MGQYVKCFTSRRLVDACNNPAGYAAAADEIPFRALMARAGLPVPALLA